ncbi:MAG: transposase [Acidobacteria bacterium]|nr:transposase [Acidobacteriota bacterium]
MAVIHTFGRDLKFNPHVHILVSEGGLDEEGRWRRVNYPTSC